LNSATMLVWIMFLALHSEFLSHA